MPLNEVDALFERVYRVVRDRRFLTMQGLGNEVPFFIQPYEPADQVAVYKHIAQLNHRLTTDGLQPLLLSLYDIVLERFETRGQLEKLFQREPTISKRRLQNEMERMLSPEGVVAPAVRARIEAAAPQLVILYEVGEVFPYLRTHAVLNNLQSVLQGVPLVVFFPGRYVSSETDGFYLSLFGKFRSDYYRAFHLADYIERARIDVNA